MSFKNDDIDSVQYENKDESGFGSMRKFDIISTKDTSLDSVISTRTGTKLTLPHPLIIFDDDFNYYYLKCRSAIIKTKDKNGKEIIQQKSPLPGEIKISPAIPKYGIQPSFLEHNSYVDTKTIFQMEKEGFQKLCQKNNIEYAFLDGEYIAKNERLGIIKQVLINLSGKENKEHPGEPDITHIGCMPGAKGTARFNLFYCPIDHLNKEKWLFDRGLRPYDELTEEEITAERERLEAIVGITKLNNIAYLKEKKENPNNSELNNLCNFFKKVLDEELQHSASNSGNSSSTSGAPQNKQHDDEVDTFLRPDKSKQKSSWVDIDKLAEEFENEIHLNRNNNLNKGFRRQ